VQSHLKTTAAEVRMPKANLDSREAESAILLESRSPIRGRDYELGVLLHATNALASGEGGWLVVSGQPGAGKTRLLEEIAFIAQGQGVRPFRGSGESEAHLTPFGPLLSATSGGGLDLLPDDVLQGLESSAENRFWVLQELQDALDHASMDGPMMIIIDDLQWCDDATFLALRTLPLRLVASPILWVVAVRDSALRSGNVVSVFERYEGLQEKTLVLRSLPDSAVSAMVEDTIGATPDEAMLRSVLQAEGLPLYVLELLKGLLDEGLINVENGVARLLGPKVPQRFRDSVRARVAALSNDGRRTLQVASVIGRNFAVDMLADMMGVSARELIDPVVETVEAGLLLEVGDDLRFSHDLFREIIQEDIPDSVRKILQRKAIDVQLARGGNVVEVAMMLANSAQAEDAEAVLLLRKAAGQLSSLTPSTSADLAVRALEIASTNDPDRVNIVTEAATYLFRAGQATRARKLIDRELARVYTAEEEALLRIGVAKMSSQFSFAEAVKQTKLALALDGLSDHTREVLEAQLAVNSLMTGDVERALDSATTNAEELAVLATFTTAKASSAFYGGHWDAAFSAMHEALVLADRAGIRYSSFGQEAVFIAFMAVSAGDVAGALREADRGVQESTRLRQGGTMRLWVMTRSRILLDAGRLADAAVEAQALLEMVDELGPGNFAEITALYTLLRVAIYEGDQAAVERLSQDANRMMRDGSPRIRNQGSWMAALCAQARGDLDEAIRLSLPVLDRLHIASPYFQGSTDPADDVVFVRLALKTGHRAAAGTMVRFIEDRALDNFSYPILRATSMHARALLTDDKLLLEKAIVLLESIDRPIVLASATEDVARITAPTDPRGSVTLYQTARALYAGAGAFREEQRVNSRLAMLGAPVERQSESSGDSAWASLSVSQRAVVTLIVQGYTNRQVAEQLYLSPHTVNAHLRFAFAKLSVHSRVQLAGLYHQMMASL
jgi:DNA-binding NarL/FixJ family response regulator